MGKVVYSPGIEYVSGALAKAKKKEGHRCGDYLIGTHRTAETTNPDCTRLYIRKGVSYDRDPNTFSDNELAIHDRFKAVARAVALRAKNLNQITTDQENFAAQKDQPGGKKTMRSYLWSLELASYDASHNG